MRENQLLVLCLSDSRSIFSARFTTRGSYRLELIKSENRYLIECFIFHLLSHFYYYFLLLHLIVEMLRCFVFLYVMVFIVV